MYHDDFRKPVDELTRKFLCGFPIKTITWDERLNNSDAQRLLVNSTINHLRNIAFPIKRSYQKAFLKWVINNLERNTETEIQDCVYNALCNLVSEADADNVNYHKHYLTECSVVSLCESEKIISEGTTGLSTWQAALVLSEWCASNKSFFKGKTILELGSGLGLVGLSLALNCEPKHVVLTDCHQKVLKLLSQNVTLNLTLSKNPTNHPNAEDYLRGVDCLVRGCVERNEGGTHTRSLISVVRHCWGEDDKAFADNIGADIILAADVVYDSSLFPALTTCINAFLQTKTFGDTKPELVLVCTERNSCTLEDFLKLLKESCQVTEEAIPEQKWFVWSTDTPIRLFKVIAN